MVPVAQKYEKELIGDGVLTEATIKSMRDDAKSQLEEGYKNSKNTEYKAEDWVTDEWAEIMKVDQGEAIWSGVPAERIRDIGNAITKLPEDATFHRLIKKIFEARATSIESGVGIDWGTAESLAMASLIQDGYKVRISGQDVERGTFSHRHAHVFYQDRDGYYIPIDNIMPQGTIRNFIASNSHLSEFAVSGYELGYAQANPNSLTIWEAQFGDFANGAQVIIDQFLSSGEAKWNVKNGLVMLLPHGYDG